MLELLSPPSVAKLVEGPENTRNNASWLTWFNNLYRKVQDVDVEFITPDSVTVNTGGTPVGTIAGVQSLHDGSVYQVPETVTTPGFDIDFTFENVSNIKGFVTRIQYNGSSSHSVQVSLYDTVGTTDDQYLEIPHNATLYQYRTIWIPEESKYINDSGQTIMSIIHTTLGQNTHNIYIDYLALLGNRRQ